MNVYPPGTRSRGQLPATTSPQESWDQHWRKVIWIKVGGVLVAVTLAMLVVPDRHVGRLFVLLTAGVYLPLSLLLYGIQRRAPRPPNPVWFGITIADIGMVGVGQALFPRLSVAFLGLTAIVMVSALLIAVRWTLFVAGLSWIALLEATMLGLPPQVSLFSALMGGLLLMGMAYLIGSLAEGERRAADRSRRLAEAIGSIGSSLDLPEVLERLCEVAREALGGSFSVVLLRDGDVLKVAGGSRRPAEFPQADLILSSLLTDPAFHDAPTARALRTMEPVAIADLSRDEATLHWSEAMARLGVHSMVASPVPGSEAPAGVLNVYAPRARAVTEAELEFVGSLAEHAGIAIERARVYAREREAVERLTELDRMKSEFVATVSHELRTPLTAIEGFALTLRDHWREFSDELRNEFLERLEDNSLSLDHLITHLLDFGRLERGEFQIQLRALPVRELVQRVLANMIHELSGHPTAVDVDPGLAVMTDRYAFDRILGNLLSNAAKFSEPGSAIEIRGRLAWPNVEVSVRDHGPGIPDESLDRVFERFYRGSQATRGTGIGLAVVKDLAGLHAGSVRVHNADPGVTFTVSLPAAPSADTSKAYESAMEAELLETG